MYWWSWSIYIFKLERLTNHLESIRTRLIPQGIGMISDISRMNRTNSCLNTSIRPGTIGLPQLIYVWYLISTARGRTVILVHYVTPACTRPLVLDYCYCFYVTRSVFRTCAVDSSWYTMTEVVCHLLINWWIMSTLVVVPYQEHDKAKLLPTSF